jgi:hypothetical protein
MNERANVEHYGSELLYASEQEIAGYKILYSFKEKEVGNVFFLLGIIQNVEQG